MALGLIYVIIAIIFFRVATSVPCLHYPCKTALKLFQRFVAACSFLLNHVDAVLNIKRSQLPSQK